MKTRHTPGPWHIHEDDDVAIDTADGRFIARIEADDGKSAEDGYIPYAEGKANAALIAAAPDLYDACRAAYAYLTPPASRFASNRKAAAALIEAALLKAAAPVRKAQGGI